MLIRRTSPLLYATALAVSALATLTAAAQVAMPAKPTVYNNPQLPDDPRVGLKGGITDAGIAESGMHLLINLPKPPGFAFGTTPQEKSPQPAPPTPPTAAPGAPPRPPRALQLGSTNSDLAFSGKYILVGNYNGFNIYDASNPAQTKLTTSVLCPGSQDDITVYGHLLFLSIESTGSRLDCGTQGIPLPAGYVAPVRTPPAAPVAGAAPGAGAPPQRSPRAQEPADPERFRGVRIFDISDILHPKQVGAVQTCRGTHTNTLVTDPADKENVYLYLSGYAPIRSNEELPGCSSGGVDDPNTALYTIVVIKVPLAHPELSKVVNSPRIFSDPSTGAMNGLAVGNLHGEGAAARPVSGCHDITTYPAIGLAAGACTAVGILLDIKDPVHPKRIAAISDPNFSFWHSAMFNNAGDRVIFSDEWGGGGQPRCRPADPMTWGADSIFTLKGNELTLDSYYKMPAPQTENENCTAHNGSLIPVPGRDIEVQSWYQGGVSVMDYTDPKKPFEIAYFDRGPLASDKFIDGGTWSAYWYNGYIYGSEIARGLDVYKLLPSKFLTQNELVAAAQIQVAQMNPQYQEKIVYPPSLITARAYVDQLTRDNALTLEKSTALMAAIDKKKSKEMKAFAATLNKDAATATPVDATRMTELAAILKKA